jgi:hypothetical protein
MQDILQQRSSGCLCFALRLFTTLLAHDAISNVEMTCVDPSQPTDTSLPACLPACLICLCACLQDIVERFQLLLVLCFVVVEDISNSGTWWPAPGTLLECGRIFLWEVGVQTDAAPYCEACCTALYCCAFLLLGGCNGLPVDWQHVAAGCRVVLRRPMSDIFPGRLCLVLCCGVLCVLVQVVIDVSKHAVLGKFNDIRPGIYREYMRDLCSDSLDKHSHNTHKLVGLRQGRGGRLDPWCCWLLQVP